MLELIIAKPQLIAVYLSYALCLWFLFILFSASKKYKATSLILFIVWTFYCACFIFGLFDSLTYRENIKLMILIDSVTGFILVTDQFISKYSIKIALTIAFAVLCHSMLLLHNTTTSADVKIYATWFYNYYDYLIALVGILQLLVSYDGFASGVKGFTRSLRFSKIHILWGYGYCVYYIQICYIYFRQKKSEKRT